MTATRDPNFETRVRANFDKQRLMTTIGATLERVEPGKVDIRLPFRNDLTQQNGFLHAGTIAAVADSACGYAALSLMPADADVLSIEFKVNMLAPAKGDAIVARGVVIRAGRTIMVCRADVVSITGRDEKLVSHHARALKAAGLTRAKFAGIIDKHPDAAALKAMFETLSFNKARVLLTYWDWAVMGTGPYARTVAS